MNQTPFDRLIAHCGSQAELARQVSVATGARISYQAVHKWRHRIPADKCLLLERLTGGAVRCVEMRPDVFADPTPAKAARPTRRAARAKRAA